MQQTNATEGTGNQTETEKQGSVLQLSINLRLQTILRDRKIVCLFNSYCEQLKHKTAENVLQEITKFPRKLSDWKSSPSLIS